MTKGQIEYKKQIQLFIKQQETCIEDCKNVIDYSNQSIVLFKKRAALENEQIASCKRSIANAKETLKNVK
jgi:hypothetical protein